ncbi:MAG: Methionyl-tRNA formyltransferase [Acidobacteriota bacterium]|nr:Methionyl-tRNA formyltransferase [Acidobacteriota bacterium]
MVNGKLVFFGTSDICIPFLEMLRDNFQLQLIVTQPDAIGGRNRKTPIIPPVKTFALENNIPMEQPEVLKDERLLDKIKALEPVLGVVIAYGKFIPASLFQIPTYRMVNVHFSLLPSYRGAAPVQRAIENGDTLTGITIFEIVKKMDAGPIWAEKQFPISPGDTTELLWKMLSLQGAGFLKETIMGILEGKLRQYPQDESKATVAPPVRKEESHVDWHLTAQQIINKARAFTPWPGVCCGVEEQRFLLRKLKLSGLSHDKEPGQVLTMDKESLKVCCGEGTVLEVLELQPPGKKPMSPFCYCLGNRLPCKLC